MKTNGNWWGFTRDGKRFFNLQIDKDDPDDYELTDAYERHPQRFPKGVPVTFVLWHETKRKVRSVTTAEIEEYRALIRSFQEDLKTGRT